MQGQNNPYYGQPNENQWTNQGFSNQQQGYIQQHINQFNQGFQPSHTNIAPPQDIAVHFIRNSKSWQKIIDEANDWINTNIHVKRVISISTVLCHTTLQGMVTIYYDKSPHLNQLVQQFSGFALGYKILQTSDKWTEQIKNTVVLARHYAQGEGRVISINQLEQEAEHHESSLTVIWFMKKI